MKWRFRIFTARHSSPELTGLKVNLKALANSFTDASEGSVSAVPEVRGGRRGRLEGLRCPRAGQPQALASGPRESGTGCQPGAW